MTTPSRVQAGSFDHDSGGTGAWTVSGLSATSSSNDLFMILTGIGTSVSWASFTGTWTLVFADTTNVNGSVAVYTKKGDGLTSYSATPSAGLKGSMTILEVTNGNGVDANNHSAVSASSATTSLTLGVSGCLTFTIGMGRHLNANSPTTLSNSDGSDVQVHQHATSSGTGSDPTTAIWCSDRAISGTDGSTVSSGGTEQQMFWGMFSVKPASITPTGRVYQAFLTAPQAAPPARGRVYQSYLQAPASSGGKTGRVYQSYLLAPLPAGHPGPSGIWVFKNGAWTSAVPYVLKNGSWT